MNQEIKSKDNDSKLEWGCRIMLTIAMIRALSGYIVFIQTKDQLVSPLIPQLLIYEISGLHMIPSLTAGAIFLIALWFYFYKKKNAVLILSGVAILSQEILLQVLRSK
jgi:hypothetical protein